MTLVNLFKGLLYDYETHAPMTVVKKKSGVKLVSQWGMRGQGQYKSFPYFRFEQELLTLLQPYLPIIPDDESGVCSDAKSKDEFLEVLKYQHKLLEECKREGCDEHGIARQIRSVNNIIEQITAYINGKDWGKVDQYRKRIHSALRNAVNKIDVCIDVNHDILWRHTYSIVTDKIRLSCDIDETDVDIRETSVINIVVTGWNNVMCGELGLGSPPPSMFSCCETLGDRPFTWSLNSERLGERLVKIPGTDEYMPYVVVRIEFKGKKEPLGWIILWKSLGYYIEGEEKETYNPLCPDEMAEKAKLMDYYEE